MRDLVQHLSSGSHKICAQRAKSAKDIKESIDRNYILLKFTETAGGTELGVTLDKTRTIVTHADFDSGTGKVQIVGTLELDYCPVELIAEIDLATLEGKGHLAPIEIREAIRH